MLSTVLHSNYSGRYLANRKPLQYNHVTNQVCRPACATKAMSVQGWGRKLRGRMARHTTCVSKRLLAEIEELKQKTDAIHHELQEVGRAAEVSAKRSRRLAERSQQLQAYALEHVMLGDEAAARAALLQKASVADALAAASRRTEANSALARKLEEVLQLQQLQLLELIRKAKVETDSDNAAVAAAAGAYKQDDAVRSDGALKRSRSVAWDSPTMHASSDGWDHDLRLPLDGCQQQQQQPGPQEQPLLQTFTATDACAAKVCDEHIAKYGVNFHDSGNVGAGC